MEGSVVQGSRNGCFSAVSRCIWGKPKEDLTRYRASERNTIEFEDLVTAENRASVVRAKKQMVTEAERELLRSGKFDELVEKQRRIDAERDAELRRQEEKLRQEEEAYYAAKREAAKRTTQLPSSTHQVSVDMERQPQSQPDVVIHHQPRATPTSLVTSPPPSQLPQLPTVSQLISSSPSPEEEDFDKFLESVKARQLSVTTQDTAVVTTVGSGEGVEGEEDDIDFGYWEKAEPPVHESALPVSTQSTTTTSLPDTGSKDTVPRTSPSKDIDLSLL